MGDTWQTNPVCKPNVPVVISGLEKPNLIVYGGGDDIKDWCREKGLLWVQATRT